MSLQKYNEKRNFNQTTEPSGKVKGSKDKVIFVVQKHKASHLHYDFRLELNGVLLSWAVPKGPSLNPDDKRLAVLVEEHPYDYKDFEGSIPKGNYGAGTVIVWDNGTYLPSGIQKDDAQLVLTNQFNKGHLSIILKGKKLKGAFSLVRIKGKESTNWLLMKKEDQHSTTKNVLLQDKSIISNKSIEQLEQLKTDAVETISEEVAFSQPMFATPTDKAFNSEEWIFENKYDGYRIIAVVNDGNTELYSRNNNSYSDDFKSLISELNTIAHNTVLDGEVVLENEQGSHSFADLQNYSKNSKGILKYYIFDILNLDGNDTTTLPLHNRKELLEMLLKKYALKNSILAPYLKGEGIKRLQQAIDEKSEGIIAKKFDSTYQTGKRSNEWLKIKLVQQEEAIIIGFTEPSGSRNYFGALLLGQYFGKELKYIGKCGTGFTEKLLKELHAKMNPIITNSSSLIKKPTLKEDVIWIKPDLVCQVKFTEWTKKKHLRHPVFLGLRADKSSSEIVNDSEKSNYNEIHATFEKSYLNTENKDNLEVKIGTAKLQLTNQNKIYFPESGITKGAMIEYYNQISNFILPYIENRPQSLNRYPNGIDKPAFYQKNIDIEKVPSWLQTKKVYSESNNDEINYLICNDKQTLLYLANLGCIELNPWSSQLCRLNNPDWAIIDIDPANENFKNVVKTALVVKEVLDELEAPCYCKTSGATGMHVYIPLHAKYNYETVKIFANLIALEVQSRVPQITTLERSIKKREGKIYIDHLQNRRGQTIAAPYCVRPQPSATVSTPLEWSEVTFDLKPTQFTINSVLSRFEEKGDLWKGVLTETADIEKIMKKMI